MSLSTRCQYLASLATPLIGLSSDWFCPICMGTSQEDVVIAHGEMHVFCRGCLASWLREAATCPACRQMLFTSIPRRSFRSGARIRSTDSYRLEQIRAYDLYITSFDGERPLVEVIPHFLRETLTRLRQRWQMFCSGTLTMDVSYVPLIREDEDTTTTTCSNDGDEGELHNISSTYLITALFASWYSFFKSRRDESTLLHHPLATGLLFAAISALKDWDGQPRSTRTLKTMMGIRLGRGFDALYPFERPAGWDLYRRDFVEIVGQVFEGVHVDKSVLGSFESRALAAVGCHEEIWRQFRF